MVDFVYFTAPVSLFGIITPVSTRTHTLHVLHVVVIRLSFRYTKNTSAFKTSSL